MWSAAVPAWVTALATFGLFAGALLTAWYAKKALKKQADEVDLLRQQAERDVYDRRRSQARLVFILSEESAADNDRALAVKQMDAAVRARDENLIVLAARCFNTSEQPVYDLGIQWTVDGQSLGAQHVRPDLKPDQEVLWTQSWTPDAGLTGVSVEFEFSDAAQIRWRTTDRGELTELCGTRKSPPNTSYCSFPPGHSGGHLWPTSRQQINDSVSQ